ncbi:MAG: 3-dehydroquinate synthase [Clostridiales bacterium]|nr:3-dehydroquinate synthase [Clostridiales bacterium]
MSYNIEVKYQGKVIYPIILTSGYDKLSKLFLDLDTRDKKICIVTDSNVNGIYTDEILPIAKENSKELYTFAFNAGEAYKNLDTVYSLYDKLIEWKFDRKDILIALGGGVVGDLTGYVAATYLRGISFVQMPTTLLSMVDSSIGGKTGVDFKGYKNMIGAFHQPSAVYINVETLRTLPRDHFYNGMAEIIKHGFILDLAYANWLKDNEEKIHNFDIDTITKIIYQSCMIKKNVVEKDPKEKGDRALLNFGHTIGHAIEKYVNFELLHGQCVSLGMVAAGYISMQRGYLTGEAFNQVVGILKDFKLPTNISTSLDIEAILDNITRDKKQESGKLKFILLKEIGQAFIETNVSTKEIEEATRFIIEKN